VSRVFVLDSHEIFRKGVTFVLDDRAEVEVVGESGSFADGVDEIASARPHVAIVGIRENERSLLDHLRSLRRSHPWIRLLVLARTDDDDALEAALRVGATGYLSKEIPADELVSAVQAVARGQEVIDPARALRVMGRRRSGEETSADPLAALTAQERKILDLIAEGLTNRQIAERLFLVEKTVRNHVTRVLAKLGVERRTQAALVAARLEHSNARNG
jgi:two-component system response regulator DevR